MARGLLTVDAYLAGLARADRAVIGRAITLVESLKPEHRLVAEALLEALPAPPKTTLRIGVTGVPGVGKSTFIEALGLEIIKRGHLLGVIAVDPSSNRSGGSILGDKTRMPQLANDPRAFIRPCPTAGTLGGVAARTREAIRILEAAGHDIIIIETVGVGQSEVAVGQMSDLFMLLALPGAGDELQGIKRGIMELADLVVVTKADGDQQTLAARAAIQLKSALRLLHGHAEAPEVFSVSALEGRGVGTVLDRCLQLNDERARDGAHQHRRETQVLHWLWTLVDEALKRLVHNRNDGAVAAIETAVRSGKMSVVRGAHAILDLPLDR